MGREGEHEVLGRQTGVVDAQVFRLLPGAVGVRGVAHRQTERRGHLQGGGGRFGHAVPEGIRAVKLKAEGGPECCRRDGRAALHLGVAPVFSGHGETSGDVGCEHVP